MERHWQFILNISLRERIKQFITDLLHALIGDSVSDTCIRGTVIEWYMQRQDIYESGRFQPMQIVRIKGRDLKRLRGY